MNCTWNLEFPYKYLKFYDHCSHSSFSQKGRHNTEFNRHVNSYRKYIIFISYVRTQTYIKHEVWLTSSIFLIFINIFLWVFFFRFVQYEWTIKFNGRYMNKCKDRRFHFLSDILFIFPLQLELSKVRHSSYLNFLVSFNTTD